MIVCSFSTKNPDFLSHFWHAPALVSLSWEKSWNRWINKGRIALHSEWKSLASNQRSWTMRKDGEKSRQFFAKSIIVNLEVFFLASNFFLRRRLLDDFFSFNSSAKNSRNVWADFFCKCNQNLYGREKKILGNNEKRRERRKIFSFIFFKSRGVLRVVRIFAKTRKRGERERREEDRTRRRRRRAFTEEMGEIWRRKKRGKTC